MTRNISINTTFGTSGFIDPLEKAWIYEWIDPLPKEGASDRLPWLRGLLVFGILLVPLVIFSALPSISFGGKLFGDNGLANDIGFLSIILFLAILLFLIPKARRRVGLLVHNLISQGIVDDFLNHIISNKLAAKNFLKLAEKITRVNGRYGKIWWGSLVVYQLIVYWMFLLDQGSQWFLAPANPGSLFHIFAIGERQPNLAGIWAFVVWSPFVLYLIVIIIRMLVIFSCLCSILADCDKLMVMPSHPDKAGGLVEIGRCALLLSSFTFALGLNLGVMTYHEWLINKDVGIFNGQLTANMKILAVSWIGYAVLSPTLFFMPQWPIHRRMVAAKQNYLLAALKTRARMEKIYLKKLNDSFLSSNIIQNLVAFDSQIDGATKMNVWPFDVNTLIKYIGMLASPAGSLMSPQLAQVIKSLKENLGI